MCHRPLPARCFSTLLLDGRIWPGLGPWDVPNLVMSTDSELEHGPVEIVDLPIENGDFPLLCLITGG